MLRLQLLGRSVMPLDTTACRLLLHLDVHMCPCAHTWGLDQVTLSEAVQFSQKSALVVCPLSISAAQTRAKSAPWGSPHLGARHFSCRFSRKNVFYESCEMSMCILVAGLAQNCGLDFGLQHSHCKSSRKRPLLRRPCAVARCTNSLNSQKDRLRVQATYHVLHWGHCDCLGFKLVLWPFRFVLVEFWPSTLSPQNSFVI